MNTSLLDEVLFRRLGQSVHTRIRAALLKTGQTTQYGGYPDDGYYQKGVAKRYEVLTTGQYSGVTNIVLNGKTDVHSNNCVLDLNTGSMWSRYPSAGVGVNSDGKLPWTTNGNGEGIFAYCTAANVAVLAGYSDWRVCNAAEIFSLLDYEAPSGYPDGVAFPSPPASIWTSNTRVDNTAGAVASLLNSASVQNTANKTTSFNCMLVRGGL